MQAIYKITYQMVKYTLDRIEQIASIILVAPTMNLLKRISLEMKNVTLQ
jgi:hypothetical protein